MAGLFYIWGMPVRNPLLLLLLLLSLVGCAQPKSLVYQDVAAVRVHKADLNAATVVVDLRFYNPNRYSVTLKDGDIDAYFNDRYLGKAILDERTHVPARDTFLLPVTITASLESIFTNALAMLVNKEVLVRLQGSLKAGKAGIYVRVPVRYEGRQQLGL